MSNEILNKIGEAAVLEQLAEECTELAQSALKLARKIRGENPTPKSLEECKASLQEEAADVELCIDILPDGYIDWTEYSRCLDAQAARLCHHVQPLPALPRRNELSDILRKSVC